MARNSNTPYADSSGDGFGFGVGFGFGLIIGGCGFGGFGLSCAETLIDSPKAKMAMKISCLIILFISKIFFPCFVRHISGKNDGCRNY